VASPLRERDFGILFAGRAVDALGDAITPAALALAVVTATRSSGALAIILICGMLPRVALLPFAGVVVDWAGARSAALASDVVSGLAQLAIGLLLLAGHLDIPPIAAAAAVGGAASAFGFQPPCPSSRARWTRPEEGQPMRSLGPPAARRAWWVLLSRGR
jgi:hypothetical protein